MLINSNKLKKNRPVKGRQSQVQQKQQVVLMLLDCVRGSSNTRVAAVEEQKDNG